MHSNKEASIYKYKYSIICCARWETPYISEWLCYYYTLGFDHIYIYCNDEDPSPFFKQIRETPVPETFYTLKHFPDIGLQTKMYIDAMKLARDETEWVSFLDIDEFLNLTYFENIFNYMNFHTKDVECVYFNWLNFKTSGYIQRPYGSVLQKYVYREPKLNVHTKYICKSRILEENKLLNSDFPFHHALSDNTWPDVLAVNAIGDNWSKYVENFPFSSDQLLKTLDNDLMIAAPHINHYQLRSAEDVVIRKFRSTSGNFIHQENLFREFLDHNKDLSCIDWGEVYDDSLKIFSETQNIYFKPYIQMHSKETFVAKNNFWSGHIELDFNNNTLKHLEHNSHARFSLHDDVLFVYWHDWPTEIFVRKNNVFFSIDS